ncbi:hypothetical protein [Rhizobium leguminosarum]|uniref:hypothetical protein n=1 Tax=Rhizobium leguminosarum TaxID=384 RepID=UPI001C947A68|nr:hypothetical protein [Rhizobium leguminosarum]MBY5751409.1 site-specific integrase [Rhizobium leguminosarum]
MDLTPGGLRWRQEDMSGIPRIRRPDGSIFEPTLRYFAFCWLNRVFKAKSSMGPPSCSLREFLCHSTNLGLDWVGAASDDVLRTFRNSFSERVKNGELSAAQVEMKLDHVFHFYKYSRKAIPYLGGLPTQQFVGRPASLAPITSRTVAGKSRWSGWSKIERSVPDRPTPDFNDVERILEHLRSASMDPLDGTWEQALRVYAAERNWLIACCKAKAGLRRGETADLSLQKIAESLAKLKIVAMPTGRWRSNVQPNPLNDAVNDLSLQAEIIAGIERHAARGYTTLQVEVATKGRPSRSIEFPLDVIIDILQIGVWQVRKALFEKWTAAGSTKLDYDAVFLSSTRNGARLTKKAVGDIIKKAFNDLSVGGSGHRLRAYYFTEMAWLLWNEEQAMAGYRNDVVVNNNVMNRLADLAGHKSPGTMEKYYLDKARLRHRMKNNRPSIDARKDMMNALISVSWNLDVDRCQRLQRLIYAVDDCNDPRFFAVMDAAIDKYVELKDRPQPERAPHLRLAVDNSS